MAGARPTGGGLKSPFAEDIFELLNSKQNVRTVGQVLDLVRNASRSNVARENTALSAVGKVRQEDDDHPKETRFKLTRTTKRQQEVKEQQPKEQPEVAKKPKTTTNSDETRVFSVMWGKYKPMKKHKTFEGDGVLVARKSSATLYNIDGKSMGTTSKLPQVLEADSLLLVGDKEVQVQHSLTLDEYTSRKCFE